MVNVGKYIIHGASGYAFTTLRVSHPRQDYQTMFNPHQPSSRPAIVAGGGVFT